ncbi:MAG: aminotransferase class IV [Xanthobacter sp.]
MKSFFNGALLDADAVHLQPGDRGFTLGDGLFETIRIRAGRIQRLTAHLSRLVRGAQVLDIAMPAYNLASALEKVRSANTLDNGVLRLTLTRGPGPRGVLPPAVPEPTLLITAAPMPPLPRPARLIVATTTRRNEFSPLCGVKSLNYLDNILARQEAAKLGADDALLLNTRGCVAESSIANIFAVMEGRLVTPPVSDGALPGVMRAAMMGQGTREKSLTPDDLMGAEELFLTSSLGIRPVTALGKRSFTHFTVAEHLAIRLGET